MAQDKIKMDVLKPQLVWLGGRCYRKYPTEDGLGNKNKLEEESDEPVQYACQDEPCDAHFEVEKLPNGKLKTSMQVAKGYFRNVVGLNGATRKRIELETKTLLYIPRVYEEGDITITGFSKSQIASARNRIELIVESARQRQAFTHFVSVPMSDLKSRYLEFCDDVLRECDGSRSLNRSLFQKPERLHLTIGTMPLLDKRERDMAIKLLAECNDVLQSILKKEPLKIQVQGLEYMNDDPAEVDVLYAKIKPSESGNRLQLVADHLVDRFVHEGIMQKQHERVKLHMTLLNTLFRKDDSGELGMSQSDTKMSRSNQRESFDATKILKKFGDYNFGEVHITSIHVSQRQSWAKNGYYMSLATLALS